MISKFENFKKGKLTEQRQMEMFAFEKDILYNIPGYNNFRPYNHLGVIERNPTCMHRARALSMDKAGIDMITIIGNYPYTTQIKIGSYEYTKTKRITIILPKLDTICNPSLQSEIYISAHENKNKTGFINVVVFRYEKLFKMIQKICKHTDTYGLINDLKKIGIISRPTEDKHYSYIYKNDLIKLIGTENILYES